MATRDFRVHISGGTVSLDNWRLAMEAEECDLPLLSEAQKEAAQRVGMAEPEYARGVLAEEIGEREQQAKGRQLGELIGDILDRAGLGWKLEKLIRRGTESIWIARLDGEGDSSQIEIPLEIADDAVDSNGAYEKGRLEKLILTSLGHPVVRKAS